MRANTHYVHDGKSALRSISQNLFDIILSDIQMPEMNGLELIKTLRANAETSHIPMILISAKANSEDISRGLKMGANDYITKPFSRNDLYNKVNNLTLIMQQVKESKGHIDIPINDQHFNAFRDCVANEYSRKSFSVSNCCEEIGISERNLLRKFKHFANTSPSEYIQTYRIKQAQERLKQTDKSISAIAESCGFSDSASFSKPFKKLTGLTPTQYRKQFRRG